jgi:hypothetical protein
MAVIYRHTRLDTNKVFYIGIGKTLKRAYSKIGRSDLWYNIINKAGYEVEVLKSDLDWNDACELEKILISYYGRRDLHTGDLVNMTIGGNGPELLTDIQRNKISKSLKGRVLTDEHKLNISISLNGIKRSDDTKLKMSLVKSGTKFSDEANSKKGKKMGNNIKAQPIEYKGELFSCKKEMWLKHFQNISYDYMTYLIRKNKIKLN